jgi:hypothetical protein
MQREAVIKEKPHRNKPLMAQLGQGLQELRLNYFLA